MVQEQQIDPTTVVATTTAICTAIGVVIRFVEKLIENRKRRRESEKYFKEKYGIKD